MTAFFLNQPTLIEFFSSISVPYKVIGVPLTFMDFIPEKF